MGIAIPGAETTPFEDQTMMTGKIGGSMGPNPGDKLDVDRGVWDPKAEPFRTQ